MRRAVFHLPRTLSPDWMLTKTMQWKSKDWMVTKGKVSFSSIQSVRCHLDAISSQSADNVIIRRTIFRQFQSIKNRHNINERILVERTCSAAIGDDKTFPSVVSRLKKLEKNRESDDINDVMSKATKLAEIFFGLASLPNMKEKMVENINTFLNFFDVLDKPSEFNQLLMKMKELCLADEATYFLLIRHEMKTASWREGLKLVENMKESGLGVHARTYHFIILNAVRSGDYKDASSIMQKMKSFQNIFHDDFYKLLVDTAAAKGKEADHFLLEALNLLKDTGFVLGPKSFGSIRKWFESDKRIWKVGTALVNIRGICKCCENQLKGFSLPHDQRIKLQEELTCVAENAISNASRSINAPKIPMFSSSSQHDPIMKMQALKHYIDNNGPFDLVLDVLNVAYYKDRGFNSFQVKRVVKHFNNMGKRVLAMCSSPLLSSLLETDTSANLPSDHMIQLLHYLRRHKCGLFFVDDTKEDGHIDDYFIILGMVYHDMNVDIVTADRFGDHAHSLDLLTKHHFQRWMRSHQIVLKKFTTNGNPVFYRRENFDNDVQSTKTSWHIPGPNKQWLCCTIKKPYL